MPLLNTIEINGTLHPVDGALSLEYYSPFIDGNNVQVGNDIINPRGKKTLPLKLQGTPLLQQALGHPNVLQKKNSRIVLKNTILCANGTRLDIGTLMVTRISQNLNNQGWTAECVFWSNDILFGDIVIDKTLQMLQMDGIRAIDGWNMDSLIQDLQTNFPDDFGYNVSFDELLMAAHQGSGIWTFFHDNPGTYNLKSTSDYATAVLQDGDDYICFPSYYAVWPDADQNALHNIFNYIAWDSGLPYYPAYIATLTSSHDDFYNYQTFRNQIVPMYYYHRVLRHCFSEFGITLTGDLLDDIDFKKLILPNTCSILREAVMTINNLFGVFTDPVNILYTQENTSIIPGNHLPDMTIVDFVLDFMLKFNAYIEFSVDGKTATIKQTALSNAVNDYNKIQADIIQDYQETTSVSVEYNFPTDDASYDEQRQFITPAAFNIAWPGVFPYLATDLTPEQPVSVDIIELLNSSDLSGLVTGNEWLDENLNSINIIDDASYPKFLVNNLVKYYQRFAPIDADTTTVELKSDLVPVEMQECTYAGLLLGDPDIDTYLPWFSHEPSYFPLRHYTFDWHELDAENFNQFTPGQIDQIDYKRGITEKKIAIYHGLQKTLGSIAADFQYPYMAFHNYAPDVPGGTDVKLSAFQLGWVGKMGLVGYFWKDFANIFGGRKVTFNLYMSLQDVLRHNYCAASVIRGRKYYVASLKFNCPDIIDGQPVIAECFEL